MRLVVDFRWCMKNSLRKQWEGHSLRGCSHSCGVYLPCVWLHARWWLSVGDPGLCCSKASDVSRALLAPFACRFLLLTHRTVHLALAPQWGTADAEIKVPSGENTELKRSPLKAWSRSVYSHTCFAYCQEFLPCLFLPFRSIHLHFFQNLLRFFPALAAANTGSCVGPQNKIGHPADAGSRVECPCNINRLKNNNNNKTKTCGLITCEMNYLQIEWSLS